MVSSCEADVSVSSSSRIGGHVVNISGTGIDPGPLIAICDSEGGELLAAVDNE